MQNSKLCETVIAARMRNSSVLFSPYRLLIVVVRQKRRRMARPTRRVQLPTDTTVFDIGSGARPQLARIHRPHFDLRRVVLKFGQRRLGKQSDAGQCNDALHLLCAIALIAVESPCGRLRAAKVLVVARKAEAS